MEEKGIDPVYDGFKKAQVKYLSLFYFYLTSPSLDEGTEGRVKITPSPLPSPPSGRGSFSSPFSKGGLRGIINGAHGAPSKTVVKLKNEIASLLSQ
ncbi:MAG TPA: hypothetical protein VII64_08805 [Thermodesulfobacteriota bacterium]